MYYNQETNCYNQSLNRTYVSNAWLFYSLNVCEVFKNPQIGFISVFFQVPLSGLYCNSFLVYVTLSVKF